MEIKIMDDSIKDDEFSHQTCDEWADLLALNPEEQLLTIDHAAFLKHVQSCSRCNKMRKLYPLITTYARHSLMVTPLSDLPPSVLEAMQKGFPPTSSGKRASFPVLSFFGRGKQPLRRRVMQVGSAVIAACILFCFVLFNSEDEVAQGKTLVNYLRQGGPVSAVAWSPNGKYVATGGWDHTVQVWDAKSGNLIKIYHHTELVDALAWSPDGTEIASGSWDHTVQVWNAFTGQPLLTHTEGNDFVTTLAWSPDGQEIASGGSDATVQIWNTQTGGSLHTYYYALGNPVDTLAWSPDGQEIAFGGRAATVQVWDIGANQQVLAYKGHGKEVDALAWSWNGDYIASGSYDATVRIWDAKTGATKFVYTGHSDIVDALAWSPDDTKIVSGSWDGTAQVWMT